ncbi:MAG: AI-2E family transporter [candidate division Zixibacteria bacterium]|nr:AI-2E family transporter [candidate division Zixibacteria bacterium]
MKREYFLISLFFLITAIIFYLFYQVIIPFFVPIAWAAVFVILFFPLYERLLSRFKHPNGASVIMCLLIVVLIIGPLTYLFIALVNEAADAVARVNALYRTGQLNEFFSFDLPGKSYLQEKLAPYYDISKIDFDVLVRDAFNKVSGVVVKQTTWLVANGTRTVFFFGLFIFAMFYFFRDGRLLMIKIKRLLPLARPQVERAISDLRDVIHATIYGGVVIALLQGFLGGLLFVIMGISSPIFWGAIMAVLSIIPLVGASLVYIPAGLILLLGGSYVKGIIVILVGVVVISQVDNVVRPLVIAGKTSLHPLMLFFTILGGIAAFGMLGLVIGPMIAAGFTIILRIFEMRLHPADTTSEEFPAAD